MENKQENEQHTAEQPIGQRRNRKGNFKKLKQIKMETQYTKTHQMLQKQF